MSYEGPQQSRRRTGAVAVEGARRRRPLWLFLLLLLLALLLLAWLLYALLHKTHRHNKTAAVAPTATAPASTSGGTSAPTSTPSASTPPSNSPGTAAPVGGGNSQVFGAALVGGGGLAAHPATGVEAAASSASAGATSSPSIAGTAAVHGPQGTVLFASNSAAIDPAGLRVIRAAATRIDVLRPSTVTVTGYTDVVGGQPVNSNLSLQRARAVAAVLRKDLGSSAPPVVAVARGKLDPIAPNTTAAGRQQNRRASITTS